MTTSAYSDEMEIAPGYKVKCWKSLKPGLKQQNSDQWEYAIKIFDARIRHRFLEPVDVLIEHQNESRKTFGFAILAIDFLVIETLQAFRKGLQKKNGNSKRLITSFLVQWNTFKQCLSGTDDREKCAEIIYKSYRCALHHSGATDGDLRVGFTGPAFKFHNLNSIKINRTIFHKELKCEFSRYLEELRNPDSTKLRCNFEKKMDAICGI